jgi:hypothetical protein
MRHFIKEYKIRVEEIEKFFVFLEGIDSIETHKISKLILPNKEFLKIDRGLQKILRSYSFLLLYNLIESTLSNGILEIYDNIHDEKINFRTITDEFKKIWIESKSKRLSDAKNESNIQNILKSIISDCNDLNEISFDKHRLSISGNLDFKTIEKIRIKYGFKSPIPNKDRKQLISFLNLIKTKRNYLGHGNESFTKASELKTYRELSHMKTEIIIYLDSLVSSIDDLLSIKKYKKTV